MPIFHPNLQKNESKTTLRSHIYCGFINLYRNGRTQLALGHLWHVYLLARSSPEGLESSFSTC